MLALSRKVGEPIIANDNLCDSLTAVQGNRVQPAFSAPKEVSIRRQERERSPHGPRKKFRRAGLFASNADCDASR